MHKAFEVHRLNEKGMGKAKQLAESFDKLLAEVQAITGTMQSQDPAGRERALVITHLELASFYAKKTMAQLQENQVQEPVFCEQCPHAVALHNPDGSCGCGIDCAAQRKRTWTR